MARDITGSDEGIDVQMAQRRLYLSFFNEMDGLIHSPKSPRNDAYPMDLWEQARALQLAEGLTNYMLDSRTGFFDPAGKFTTFSRTVASVINELSRFAALTGNPQVAERVKRIYKRSHLETEEYDSEDSSLFVSDCDIYW